MNRDNINIWLKAAEPALRSRGSAHAARFGSRTRDTDIMIEIDPATAITVYDYVALKNYIASLFDRPVDVIDRDGLKPYLRPAVTADAVYTFYSLCRHTTLVKRHRSRDSLATGIDLVNFRIDIPR